MYNISFTLILREDNLIRKKRDLKEIKNEIKNNKQNIKDDKNSTRKKGDDGVDGGGDETEKVPKGENEGELLGEEVDGEYPEDDFVDGEKPLIEEENDLSGPDAGEPDVEEEDPYPENDVDLASEEGNQNEHDSKNPVIMLKTERAKSTMTNFLRTIIPSMMKKTASFYIM